MCLLMVNIADYRICIGLAAREHPFAALPMKPCKFRSLRFDPLGGTGLHNFYYLRHWQRPRQAEEKMDVVRSTPDAEGRAVVISQHHGKVGMQFRADGRCQYRDTVFGAENQVNQDTR